MKCLFVVNILLSARTAGFWRKNRIQILEQFEAPEIFYPESVADLPHVKFSDVELIVLIGDDGFFHWAVNRFYDRLMENLGRNILAFVPDSRGSALADGLGLPWHFDASIKLIKRKQTVPLDLLRCHYIDHHGFPASCLVLNDVVIGLPPIKLPLVIENLAHWLGALPLTRFRRRKKQITLVHDGNVLFDGDYLFGLLLLGRKVTRGPRFKRRLRINLAYFEYLQVNSRNIRGLITALPGLLSGRLEDRKPEVLHFRLAELEAKGVSQDNKLIVDGTHVGKLPASFTLLPKSIRVISPLITVKAAKTWKGKLAAAKVPKPVGSREIADFPRNLNCE